MYLRAEFRGEEARHADVGDPRPRARRVEIVTLTAMSDNPRALAFYRRWGFAAYGVEPAAVKYEEVILMRL